MSTSGDTAGYAYWTSPDGSSKVVYSLSLLHEIDGIVNESYRRIPHGGVETGGVLFGRKSGEALQLETQRPIQCQHAFGPSFVLSESDLAGLHEQLAAAASDPDLAELEPVGWFIGHTRTPLQLSEREVLWFEELFPASRCLTLVVKPERFQPTRFAFLLRNPSGAMQQDGTHSAFILPLTGHASQAGNLPSASIPAPRSVERPAPSTPMETEIMPPPRTGGATRVRPTPAAPVTPVLNPTSEVINPHSDFRSVAPEVREVIPEVRNTSPEMRGAAPLPVAQRHSDLGYPYATLPDRGRATRVTSAPSFGIGSAAVLLLAALLGCIAGYWAYLQLPSPVIPVRVREQRSQLVVEWPAAQTAGVEYAGLQVNDGQWLTLSSDQKTGGRAVISAPEGDLKIDLLAKHWLRDSRGIVRYLRTPRAPH